MLGNRMSEKPFIVRTMINAFFSKKVETKEISGFSTKRNRLWEEKITAPSTVNLF